MVKMLAATSATTIDHQMPSAPKKIGNSTTHPNSKTNISTNAMSAEILPFSTEVNMAEPKYVAPISKNEIL